MLPTERLESGGERKWRTLATASIQAGTCPRPALVGGDAADSYLYLWSVNARGRHFPPLPDSSDAIRWVLTHATATTEALHAFTRPYRAWRTSQLQKAGGPFGHAVVLLSTAVGCTPL